MAKLNIHIFNPLVNLISNYNEISNSCITLFTFDVNTVAGNSITVDLIKTAASPYDYDIAEISVDDGAKTNLISGDPHILPGGKATIYVSVGNTSSASSDCNEITATVTDINRSINESRDLIRCNNGSRC